MSARYIEDRAKSCIISRSLMVDYMKSFGGEQLRQLKQSQFYTPSMYIIVFTSYWLEPLFIVEDKA